MCTLKIIPSCNNDIFARELSSKLGVTVLPLEPPLAVIDEGDVLLDLSGGETEYPIDLFNSINLVDLAESVKMQGKTQDVQGYADVLKRIVGGWWQ